jgi:asparagine synthase (glutamine-hydrolysing)
MCGIAGAWGVGFDHAERMARTLTHRGPDGVGSWSDASAGLALAHARLSIVDLSQTGRQPMLSSCGRYAIVLNGEIYNYRELRGELAARGSAFRGTSDTEVFLELISRSGLNAALSRANGMFAFALWDRAERRLQLVRDRLGEKPLYYGWAGSTLLFGSELKALRAHPAFAARVNRESLGLFARHSCVPAPYSIYEGVLKALPGAIVTFEDGAIGDLPRSVLYWSLREAASEGLASPFRGTEREAAEELERLLRRAVKSRMHADVPLGAFLSGGIDSSMIVALMQQEGDRAARTFTIGYGEGAYDEADHAKAVSAHLKTDHTELRVTPAQALDAIPRLASVYDEPFADSSQIPTLLVSELARGSVKVALSGDGGDELFGGYNRHTWGRGIWRGLGRIPVGVRRLASMALTAASPHSKDGISRERIQRLAGVIAAESAEDMYLGIVTHWGEAAGLVLASSKPATLVERYSGAFLEEDPAVRMMYLDTATYLPDDILTKLDRASMAVGLEARAPLLDHRLVEFAWRLPLDMKLRGGRGKWLLRQVLDRLVPRVLADRPKKGFGAPICSWLRGPLRPWAEELLDEGRLRRDGYFDPKPIRARWAEHLSGRRDWQYPLWDILMFQAWLDRWR